jgi:hypothetical protein
MKTACLCAAGLALAVAGRLRAQASFPDLDLDALKESAADFRHRAALLRRSVGLRERNMSDAEGRAAQILQAAQADAEQKRQAALAAQQQAGASQAGADMGAGLARAFLGNGLFSQALQVGIKTAGSAAVANANAGLNTAAQEGSEELAQAQRSAAPLREQARAFEGEKKKLALKADQYEQLADAKDLLIAAETLRRQAEEAAKTADDADKAISSAKSFVDRMDVFESAP